MFLIIKILIGIIAFLHLYILWFEMFAWVSRGPKVFKKFPAQFFEPSKGLAANQGLYNGFLAAGLIWSLLIPNQLWSIYVAVFFLVCVAVAGIYGAYSAEKRIFVIQALPALVTLLLILLHNL